MSKHYWDEYLNVLLNHNELDRILKFHQSNVTFVNPEHVIKRDINKMDWIAMNKNKVIFSDIVLKKYMVSELPSYLKEVYKTLKGQFSKIDTPLILPIFSILKSKDIEKGLYTFNFEEGIFIKYKELPEKETFSTIVDNDLDICLSYFLNIERAIFLYEGGGYINGILQVGEISGYLASRLNFKILNVYLPSMEFSKDLGINVRKQMLIKNDCWVIEK